jgi:hypothetical protein
MKIRAFFLWKDAMKRCVGCGELKEEIQFARSSGYRDGLYNMCRTCNGRKRKEYEEKRCQNDPSYAETRKKRRIPSDRQREYRMLGHLSLAERMKIEAEKRKINPPIHIKGYRMGQDQYDQMTRDQDGKCAICGMASMLCVDHNHSTGKIRGLLCTSCNAGIGLLKDSAEVLMSAAKYLERFSDCQRKKIS